MKPTRKNLVSRIKKLETRAVKKVATVEVFLAVLDSKLTQYDMSESRKEMKRRIPTNIYRLGHLLGASSKVRDDMKKANVLKEDSPEALEKLKKSLGARFIPGFRPVKTVLKRIDAYIKTGKFPSLK
jgi:hypothetical protein